MTRPVVLCILDGWGLRNTAEGNAPLLAETPFFDHLIGTCPNSTLITYGRDVGLPHGQMGNSEVGHMNIGAGRVVQMDLVRIDSTIEEGRFGQNPEIVALCEDVANAGGRVHLFGLVSDGGVHGQLDHMIAAARAITERGLGVAIHAITDGRDVAPKSASEYVEALEAALPKEAQVVTVIGRYFAMDRDNRWERVAAAYQAIMHGKGAMFETAKAAIDHAYAAGQTDEFITASIVGSYDGFAQQDGFFCLNFRSDRARQIMAALGDLQFEAFNRRAEPAQRMLGMASYSDGHDRYMRTAFAKEKIKNSLGAWVAEHGLRQFRVAETEKYPHVTFFLNGGKEPPETGEDRHMAPSPKVATYDLAPEMAASEVAQKAAEAVERGYDLIVVNFANPDMVGHTGSLRAAQKACEATDAGLGLICAAVEKAKGQMIVTADHGNCEVMIDPDTGEPHTAHTLSPVPVILMGAERGVQLRGGGRLADLAPTVLELMGLHPPQEMTGTSLLWRG